MKPIIQYILDVILFENLVIIKMLPVKKLIFPRTS